MGAPKGNKFALGNKGGRPSTYDPLIIDEVQKYLKWCEGNPIDVGHVQTKVTSANGMNEDGYEKVVKKQENSRLPSLAGFARHVNIPRRTLISWGEQHEEFSTALNFLLDEQRMQLIELGRAGEGNSRFAMFMLSAAHGMREKTDVTSDGKALPTPILQGVKNE